MADSSLFDRFLSATRLATTTRASRRQSKRSSSRQLRRRMLGQLLEDRRVLAAFTVVTAGDAGTGTCTDASCTLRDAIESANDLAGADTITFGPSFPATLTTVAELTISDAVTITGPGSGALTISPGVDDVRAFNIETGDFDVTIEGVSITGADLEFDSGGAIQNRNDGVLTIRNSVLSGNQANNGSAIYSEYGGTVEIIDSELTGNVATYGGGGAIQISGGNAVITGSVISGNDSYGNGGAIHSPNDGSITITDSTINDNEVTGLGYQGGAIYSGEGAVTVTGSTLSGNTATSTGGAIYSIAGGIALDTVTINDNVAGDIGGAIFNDNGPITVVDSTFNNNQAQYGDGGAISNNAGDMTLTRSTISNNRSFTDGGGISNVRGSVLIRDSLLTGNTSAADGGGIASVAGPLTITNSTIHDNSANLSGGGIQTDTAVMRLVNSTVTDNSASLSGGGIGTLVGLLVEDIDAQMFIDNTIVAGNIAPTGADINAPRDPATNLQVRHSLIGNNASTTLTASATPDTNGNLIGTPSAPLDPQLEALANNGGLTLTQAPMATSPVIDRGDNALALDFGADGAPGGGDDVALASDGRGVPFVRFATSSAGGETTDIGAFEIQPRPSFTVDTLVDEDDGDFSFGDVSLREVLGLANASEGFDNIFIAASLMGTIELNPMLGPLVISDTVNIAGPGADQLSVSVGAGDPIRLVDVTATAGDVSISGLSFLGGDAGAGDGGAIRSASPGTLRLKNVELTDNRAANGGAIFAAAGTLQLAATTLANNTASVDGGGISTAGLAAPILMVNTTLTGNTAGADGGGIHLPSGDVTVVSSTIASNNAVGDGGGIWVDPSTSQSVSITSSIVAGNTAAGGDDFIAPSNPVSNVNVRASLIGTNDQTSLTESMTIDGVPQQDGDGNLIGGTGANAIDPLLGPLADNGGDIRTVAPLGESLAVDNSNAAVLPQDEFDLDRDNNPNEILPVDARGAPRQSGILDMGAVELPPAPSVSWDTPADIVFGTALGSSQLNATSIANGSFVYTPPAGTILDAGDGQVLSAVFMPTDPLAFRSASISTTINVAKADAAVVWDTPDPITFGTALGDDQLNATSVVDGTFQYMPAADTVLDAGTTTLNVTFTPTDSDNFNVTPATTTLVVNPATPTVTWDNPAGITFGETLTATQLNATSDLAGTFVYTPAIGDPINAGDGQTLSVVFTPEDPNFAETTFTVTIDVAKATPVVSWAEPAGIDSNTPLDDTQLNATADVDGTFVYSPAAGATLPAGEDQTLSVTFTPTDSNNFNSVTAEVMIDVAAVAGFDFGDAPAPYPTLLDDDGARHDSSPLRLGASIDVETEGTPSDAADGDGADEDGAIAISTLLVPGSDTVVGSFEVLASDAGKLDAWIDFNGNGSWDDPGEQIATSLDLTAGSNLISYTVPVESGTVAGETFARFRLSTAGDLSPTGAAVDGEVEDYAVQIETGDGSATALVNAPVDAFGITLASGSATVSDLAQTTLFSSPTTRYDSLTVQASDADNQIEISGDDAITALSLGGGEGTDTVQLQSVGLDLTSASVVFTSIETLAMVNEAAQTITLNVGAAATMSGDDQTTTVTGSDGDQLLFSDRFEWTVADPVVVDGVFMTVITHEATGEIVRTNIGSQWQNPLAPSDVNRNGNVTAGDALLVINELGRRTYSDGTTQVLQDAAVQDPFPGFYYDQNGDGRATALDALRVINELARQSNSGEREGEWTQAVDVLVRELARVTDHSTNADRSSSEEPALESNRTKIASFDVASPSAAPAEAASMPDSTAQDHDDAIADLLASGF